MVSQTYETNKLTLAFTMLVLLLLSTCFGLKLYPTVRSTLIRSIPSIKTSIVDMTTTDDYLMTHQYDKINPKLDHLPLSDKHTIEWAFMVSYVAHKNQFRESGQPYIVHPVEVAKILADCDADCDSITSALLHDTVEDTNVEFVEIQYMFGAKVCQIVKGVTKVTSLAKKTKEYSAQAASGSRLDCEAIVSAKLPQAAYIQQGEQNDKNENLRNMFIAMSDDWRIIHVKLADRLHNMRTLEHLSTCSRKKIAKETKDIYVPLAHKLGMYNIKTELEDISFEHLHPRAYRSTLKKINERHNSTGSFMKVTQSNLESLLINDWNCKVECRIKSVFSTWKKSKKYNCKVDNVRDLLAFRVIVPDTDTELLSSVCYSILGKIHSKWTPIPNTIKDYINNPKENGYQSIHTSIMIDNTVLEIQVRTQRMHRVAEYGTASHWSYKDVSYSPEWMKVIRKWDEEVPNTEAFIELIREELLTNHVFVFLPNGNVKKLKKGTTLNNTYDHSTILVNGKRKHMHYKFRNGDVIKNI